MLSILACIGKGKGITLEQTLKAQRGTRDIALGLL